MANRLRTVITSADPLVRDEPLDRFCRAASAEELFAACDDLDRFRRGCDNLYERVRALFFLYAVHRFHLPLKPGLPATGRVPFEGYRRLLARRFEEAIHLFLAEQQARGPSDALCSALAAAYRELAFQVEHLPWCGGGSIPVGEARQVPLLLDQLESGGVVENG